MCRTVIGRVEGRGIHDLILQKSVNIIHPVNKLKDKRHLVISATIKKHLIIVDIYL